MESNEKLKKIKDSISDNLWLNSWIKEPLIELIDKAIDPTPTTVDCGFSKLELSIIRDDVFGSLKEVAEEFRKPRRKIINTIDGHLLTNANEWPKMMKVSVEGNFWYERMVICIYQGYYIAVDGDFSANRSNISSWQHARPIEPKPKELKDLKEGDNFWDKETLQKRTFIKIVNRLVFYNTGITDGVVLVNDFNDYFQLTPPTKSQKAAAKAAAIEEVEKRFAEMEVRNG